MDEALPSITVLFPLLSASASLSLLLIHIGAYLRFRSLRRHPASLVFGRCLYDLLFCFQLAYQLTRIKTAAECKAAAALMQFSMLASESCFLGISIDLRHALTQPFHDYKLTRRSLNLGIFVANAAIAVSLAWRQRDAWVYCHGVRSGSECLPVWLSFDRGGSPAAVDSPAHPNTLLVCWIHDTDGSIDWMGVQLYFFMPVLAIYIYSAYVYCGLAARRLRVGGLKSSLETRRVVLERSRRLLFFYNSYVVLQALPYAAMFFLTTTTLLKGPTHQGFVYYGFAEFFLVVLGARGIATVMGYYLAAVPSSDEARRFAARRGAGTGAGASAQGPLYTGAAARVLGMTPAEAEASAAELGSAGWVVGETSEEEEEEEALRPELNAALRDEILVYTAQGIERAVLHSEAAAATAVPAVPRPGPTRLDLPDPSARTRQRPVAASYSADSLFVLHQQQTHRQQTHQHQQQQGHHTHPQQQQAQQQQQPHQHQHQAHPAHPVQQPRGNGPDDGFGANGVGNGFGAAEVHNGFGASVSASLSSSASQASRPGRASGIDSVMSGRHDSNPALNSGPFATGLGAAFGGFGGLFESRVGCAGGDSVSDYGAELPGGSSASLFTSRIWGSAADALGSVSYSWGPASRIEWRTSARAETRHAGSHEGDAQGGLRGDARAEAGQHAGAHGGGGGGVGQGSAWPGGRPSARDSSFERLHDGGVHDGSGAAAEVTGTLRHKVVHRGAVTSLESTAGPTALTLTDYEPDRFRQIRRAFGIEARPFLEALRHKSKERFTEGRSGAFLYFSENDQFVVKTCTAVEARTLRQMLPRYTTHLLAQPNTTLSKIFGLYALDLYGRRLHFVVMANILAQTPLSQTQPQPQPHPQPQPQPQPQPEAEAEGSLSAATSSSSWGFGRSPRQLPQPEAQPQAQPQAQAQQPEARENIHERYDLKGSWVDRNAKSVAELRGRPALCRYCDRRYVVGLDTRSCALRFNKPCLPEQQLKDNDLNYKLNLRPQLARALAQQLRDDVDFLASVGLMDYSLLLGVTRRRFDLQPTRPARTGSASDALSEPLMPEGSQFEAEFIDGPAIYYVGLIDILTRWDFEKRREYVVKTLVGKNRHGISCVPPREYVERFKRRVVEAIVEGRDNN